MEYCSVGSCSDLMKICKRTFSEDQIRFICKEILQVCGHCIEFAYQNLGIGLFA